MKTDRRELWLMVALTFVGTVLRLADLTGRSMWLDEGFTLTRLAGSWQDILQNVVIMQGIHTTDLHPPLYFLILKAWSLVIGDSEFILKLIPALASILLIPATFVLARRLFTRRIALLAALLALLSPAYQWYGHELRMYTVVPLLAALSNYTLYIVIEPRRMGIIRWGIWIGLSAASLFTHYSLLGLLVAQLIFIGLVIFYKRPKLSRRGINMLSGLAALVVVGTAVAVATLDIYNRVLLIIHSLNFANPVVTPLDWIVANVVNSALFGMNATDPTYGPFVWFVVGVCLAGLLLPVHLPDGYRRTVRARLFLGLAAIFPMLFVGLLSIVINNRPSFRYSILVVPALHVLMALVFSTALSQVQNLFKRVGKSGLKLNVLAGLRAIGPCVGMIALLSVFVAQVFGLAFTFIHTPTWQDDWRGTAQYIKDNWQPGDVVFVNLFTPEDVVGMYLKDVPIEVISTQQLPVDKAARQQLMSRYGRVWFANSGGWAISPDTIAGQILLPLHKREQLWFPSQTTEIQLMLFDVKSTLVQSPPDAASVHLVQQKSTKLGNADIVAYQIRPGDPYHRYSNMRLSLYWHHPAGGDDLRTYSVSVRIKTADQRAWADWFLPARLEAAPPDWTTDNLYRADYIVPVPVGLPKQSYQLELAIGKGEKAEVWRSIVQPLDQAELDCCVRILRWPVSSNVWQDPTVWRTTDIALSTAEFPGAIMPGEILPVVLTWKLDAHISANWQTVLRFDGLLGGNVVESTGPTGTDEAPVTAWPIGEPVRTMHSLQLPFPVKAGYYRLSVARKLADGHEADGVLLGIVQVKDYPVTLVAQNIAHPVSGRTGELALLGYSLDRPFTRTVTLHFDLYWRVESQPKRDGVLFLHVYGPDGKMVAQDDNPPEQGKRSTITYRPGEGIAQVHRVVIPGDTPGGDYRLYAGIYDRDSKRRWPAQQDGAAARDDLLFLGTLTLPDLPNRPYGTFLPLVMQGG